MSEVTVEKLQTELSVARNEIQNLRKQITALSHVHRKDIEQINGVLERFRCNSSVPTDPGQTGLLETPVLPAAAEHPFKPIGIIRTVFPEKRAVPRQAAVGSQLLGCIELASTVFTNPEHALEGLDEFSHIWIIYHFHKNEPCTKSKVAPPRLNGQRVGVFSTRSPHRPCPIGISLVELQRIESSSVYFLGTDMVDGTPVLDIKPYIPSYDSPVANVSVVENTLESIVENGTMLTTSTPTFFSSREDPDGEESVNDTPPIAGSSTTASVTRPAGAVASPVVRVPDWIMSAPTLRVLFNERANAEIQEIGVDKKSIIDVMSADPRSVYIRTKYGSQIFTFQLGEVAVTCKFDDTNATVTIVRIRKSENLPTNDWQTQSIVGMDQPPSN